MRFKKLCNVTYLLFELLKLLLVVKIYIFDVVSFRYYFVRHSSTHYIFLLFFFVEKNPQDVCAWNMLGILRERLGLKESTLYAFANAYEKAPEKHRDLTRVNYGRSLYKMGKYTEAINVLQEVQEATFSSGSTLALALFNGKKYLP